MASQNASKSDCANSNDKETSASRQGIGGKILTVVHAVVMWIMTSVPPVGSRPLRIKHAINMHKLACPLVVSALMLYCRNRGLHCYCYLAMHGSYGLAWLIKDATFPDRSWEAPASVSSFFVLFTLMALFWIAPYLVVTSAPPSAEVLFFCLALFNFGFFFLHVGDAQKFFTLRIKSGLISDGMQMRMQRV